MNPTRSVGTIGTLQLQSWDIEDGIIHSIYYEQLCIKRNAYNYNHQIMVYTILQYSHTPGLLK